MIPWQYILAALICLLLVIKIRAARKKRRALLERDFSRKLETVLQPRENVKLVYPTKQGKWVLTSRRLLLDTKEGFTSVPFRTLKKAVGTTKEGKKTTSARQMSALVLNGEREFIIENCGGDFETLAKTVVSKTKKENEKKKAKKGTSCKKEKK